MIQAAAIRGIDFSKADILDRRWNLKLRLITQALAREQTAKACEMLMHQHLAALAIGSDIEKTWENADKYRRRALRAMCPWLSEETDRDIADRMVEQYEQLFGDTTSPEFEKSVDAVIEMWHKQREQPEDTEVTAALRQQMGSE